jgi:hypothetical protein
MEVKRAFRCYRGPDDPGPFSDIINSMSFGCRHMKEFNKNGVFCLTANTPEGYVKVLRVGDVDYIWTEGGASISVAIILIPDLIGGWKIPVTCKKNDYSFLSMVTLDGKENILRYEFNEDVSGLAGTLPRFEYVPYIAKRYDISHVSVGHGGNTSFLSPWDDWHYKHYIVDCTGPAGDDDIWRPPSQGTKVGFSVDLHPPWYSMSTWTAHGFHYCFEAAIDQLKRIYQPINVVVRLDSEEISVPDFTLLERDGLVYNFAYPVKVTCFYGKNAFTYILNSNGIYELISFGESVYISGAGVKTIPDNIDPVYFFWPWIPYLDEVRGFNILQYGPNQESSLTGTKWFVTPSVAAFYLWGIGSYNKLGQYATQELFADSANFSTVTYDVDGNSVITEYPPCSCGDCGVGSSIDTNTQVVPPYSSSGTRYVPIGLIGGKIPISMKTMWAQNGVGPTYTSVITKTMTGTYPFLTILGPGYLSIIDLYKSCCENNLSNTATILSEWNESASNAISISQYLKVGDDVIFSGESSMSYGMTYTLTENYLGTVSAAIDIPDYECSGSISYTSQQMQAGATQTLAWLASSPPPCDSRTFLWSLSGGGSLSSLTEQTTTYTAPDSNSGCNNNATISLSCDGVVVDTLEITINAYAAVAAGRYYSDISKVCQPATLYTCTCLRKNYTVNCDGSLIDRGYVGGGTEGITMDCTKVPSPRQCEPTCYPVVSYVDTRSAAQIAAGCCPAQLM